MEVLDTKKWLILIGHNDTASHVVNDMKALGYNVLYVGNDPVVSNLCDQSYIYQLPQQLENFYTKELESIRKMNIAGVFSFLENMKTIEVELSQKLNLLYNPTQAYQLCRDKNLFREFLRKIDVPMPRCEFITHDDKSPEAKLNYPFICKPNKGYASGGVRLVKNDIDFKEAIKVIRRLNRFVFKNEDPSGDIGVLCEEYIDGSEYSVDSITIDGVTKSFLVCERGFPGEENFSDFIYRTGPGYDEILTSAQEIIGKILSEMNYKYGPSHAEFRMSKYNNQLMILEIGLRVGFVGNIGRLCKETTGIEYNQLAIKSSMQELSLEELKSITPYYNKFGMSLIPDTAPGGKIVNIKGLDFLNKNKNVSTYHFTKKVGDVVVPYPKGLEYLGEILLVAETADELESSFQNVLEEFCFEYEQI